MNDKIRSLLLQIAGFLTLHARALPPYAQKEAEELLNKIGDAVAFEGDEEG